ncbi:MAG: NusG domain II-containing protein [Nitrospirae bacterium]|nr:NusG domain II-containing protein [Nitrospirota bacterium]
MLFIGRLVPKGSEVTIEVNNELLYKFPIDKDRSVKISHMEIEIKDGKVRVADADCPNKLCVKQGWIDRGAIICLPNRVVISVVNPYEKHDRDDEVDAISG